MITTKSKVAIGGVIAPRFWIGTALVSRFSRRAVLSVLSGSVVTACTPFEKTSPFWGTISAGIDPPHTPAVTRDYADRLPYASMLAWFGKAPKALIVLAEAHPGGLLTWHSAERQAVTTFGPFVVKAIGTEYELRNTTINGLPTPNLLRVGNARVRRSLDVLAEDDRVQVEIASRFERKGEEAIEILGVSRNLVRVDERVESGGRYRYTNRYWIDQATGRCWKSRQIVVPRLPPLNLELVKPPAIDITAD